MTIELPMGAAICERSQRFQNGAREFEVSARGGVGESNDGIESRWKEDSTHTSCTRPSFLRFGGLFSHRRRPYAAAMPADMADDNHPPVEQDQTRVRLQRYLADAGVAARRVCEQMIEQGRVQVNGETISRLPAFIDPQSDRVEVDGRLVAKPQAALTILVHKPQRVLVTASDEPGMDRATILDLVDHPAGARLFPVGRLGWDDAGLVVLTNDGELANALSHPRYGVPKRYEVLVAGVVGHTELAKIRRQAKLVGKASAFEARRDQKREQGEGPLLRRAKAKGDLEVVVLDQEAGSSGADQAGQPAGKAVLGITMGDAKGKPLRDILHGAGLPVRKLTRVAIGPLTLRGLRVGAWREVTRDELRVLRAIVDDGHYDEQRAMKLLQRGDPSHREQTREQAREKSYRSQRDAQGGEAEASAQRAAPFWPAPVLRQEAMKQQRAAEKKSRFKPRTISDQLLAERQEAERAEMRTPREKLPREEERGERARPGGARPGSERAGSKPARSKPARSKPARSKPDYFAPGERPAPRDRSGAPEKGNRPAPRSTRRSQERDVRVERQGFGSRGEGRSAMRLRGAMDRSFSGKPAGGKPSPGKPAFNKALGGNPKMSPANAAKKPQTPMDESRLIRRRPRPPVDD